MKKRKLIWFNNRIEYTIVMHNRKLQTVIIIASLMHAKALYLSQVEKGLRYTELQK